MPEQLLNPNQNPNQAAELQLREQLLNQFEAESAGTVALYTHMPVNEVQKASMVQTQRARGGSPGVDLMGPGRGGWGQFGERPAQTSKVDEGEYLDFTSLENGNVDIRYAFTRGSGYNDEHGRPGNMLLVQFILPPASAGKLRESLQADPSFINDVIKRQVGAIGLDTEGNDWRHRLEPHYYDRKTFTVMPDKDRVLHVRDTDATGKTVIAEQALTYGENKSLLPAQTPEAPVEQMPQVSEAQPTAGIAEVNQASIHQPHQELVQSIVEGWDKSYQSMEAAGKTPAEILEDIEETYANEVDMQRDAETRGAADEISQSKAIIEALDTLHTRYAETTRKQNAVSLARSTVRSVHTEITAATPVESVPKLNGEPVNISERYKDAKDNEWVVIGNRHIRASQLDK